MSNIRPYLIINGVNSQTITGLLITSLAPITKAPVRVLTDVIDGRDGDSNIKLGYSAYDKVVGIGLTQSYDVNEIIKFFNSEGVVTFSNEPDKYYKFAIYEQLDLERLIRYKTGSVTFHIQPFKYSTTQGALKFTTPEFTVTNSGNIEAKPLIAVTGRGYTALQINNFNAVAIDFGDIEQTVVINPETMNAYYTDNIRRVEALIDLIQAGTGSPAPDNVRAITGFDSCNAVRAGKNLAGYSSNGYIDANGDLVEDNSSALCRVIHTQGKLTISKGDANSFGYAIFTDSKLINMQTRADALSSETYTIDNNSDVYIFAWFYFGAGANVTEEIFTNAEIQIETGAEATAYEIYSGDVYTIDFEEDETPLTVYGGSIDYTTGLLKIEKEGLNFESITWTYDNGLFVGTLPDAYDVEAVDERDKYALCEQYAPDSQLAIDAEEMTNKTWLRSSNYIFVKDTTYSSTEDFITANTGLKVVYELAEPKYIELDAVRGGEIIGLNQVYSDSGDVIVTYNDNGLTVTEEGAIVSFILNETDIITGDLANRIIIGNYDNIKLKTGLNNIKFTGSVFVVGIENYSRWL